MKIIFEIIFLSTNKNNIKKNRGNGGNKYYDYILLCNVYKNNIYIIER